MCESSESSSLPRDPENEDGHQSPMYCIIRYSQNTGVLIFAMETFQNISWLRRVHEQ